MEDGKQDALMRRPEDALQRVPVPPERIVTPVADLFETGDAFIMKLDMPGTAKECIHLSIESDRLAIRASVAVPHPASAHVLFSEIGHKKYLREFNLGDGIDRDKIDALYEDGVLTILLPKTEALRPRTIPIR